MDDADRVQVVESERDLGHVELDGRLLEASHSIDMNWIHDDQLVVRARRRRKPTKDRHLRSPPSIRSSTKKQFSSSWKAYRKLTTKGWSICEGEEEEREDGQVSGGRGRRRTDGTRDGPPRAACVLG